MAQSTSTLTSTTPVRPPGPRRTTSRFMEAAMNSRSSIHPPPDMVWQDLGIENLLDKFHEEANAPARSRPDSGIGSLSSTSSVAPTSTSSTTTSEGTFGRFSRAVSSFFHGSGFSNLGKRKAGADSATANATAPPVDSRREQARIAYEHAKEMGLLPTPKVFVRPQARPRRKSAGLGSPQTPLPPASASPARPLDTPQRPIYKSASRKDLNKQKKLSKRVSNLEHKLSEAKKELNLALALKQQEAAAASKLLSSTSPVRPMTPNNTRSTENEASSTVLVESTSNNHANKITKKRKATTEKTISIYGESDVESEPSAKKTKNVTTPRRQSTRLRKSRSNASINTTTSREEIVTVVPGGSVPPMPLIPMEVEGNRVVVGDDGFGGLSHEIF